MIINTVFYAVVVLFFSTVLFAQEPKANEAFRTFVTIEKVSEGTSIEVMMPNQKGLTHQEMGKKYEIPFSVAQKDQFKFVVQMSKSGKSINPCEFSIDQLKSYDRSYVCSAQGATPTQVVVRVFTNLHGGDKVATKQVLARR